MHDSRQLRAGIRMRTARMTARLHAETVAVAAAFPKERKVWDNEKRNAQACGTRGDQHAMIKYIGSKRRMIGHILDVVRACDATSLFDGFTGTTRVAQAAKRDGLHVVANDLEEYSHLFAQCYIATDADECDMGEIDDAIAEQTRSIRPSAFRWRT